MKAKTVVVPEKEIDWSKPIWVVGKDGDLLLTNGENGDGVFTATVIKSGTYDVGRSSNGWCKAFFKPVVGNVNLVISNG